jgi:hypothetical protein
LTGSSNLYLALIHYPVYNKHGEVIASAVSNLDLHDISRAAKTYGAQAFYVVTPLTDQRELSLRILSHWTQEAGATYNPDRKDALKLARVVSSLDAAIDDISNNGQGTPATVVTDARPHWNNISYSALSDMLKTGRPYLLIFGTAWGLTREFMERANYVLAPVMGPTTYNHLSVRSAAAIVLDRLLGTDRLSAREHHE